MQPGQHELKNPDLKAVLFSKLSDKEKAIFNLLERISKLERETVDQPTRAVASWGLGRTTDSIIAKAIEFQEPYSLPIPNPEDYKAFGLLIAPPWNEEHRALSNADQRRRRQEYPTRGSGDMRLIDFNGNAVKIFANTGSLASMESEWRELIDDPTYPLVVEDRHGFVLKNDAYKQKLTENPQ